MAGWTIADYDVLFENHPPTQPTAPTTAEGEALGLRIGCSGKAAVSQWNDGRSVVLGHRSDASQKLKDYVRSRGWLSATAAHP